MKSDIWITERIARESIGKRDISHMKRMVMEGFTDEEILRSLRRRMVANSKSLQTYIRQEKILGLMLKLSFRVHWALILPVIEKWLEEKESVVGWSESKHDDRIAGKARQLREMLSGKDNGMVSRKYFSSGKVTDETMEIIEEVAEMLLNELEGGEKERASRDGAAGSQHEPSRNALQATEMEPVIV